MDHAQRDHPMTAPDLLQAVGVTVETHPDLWTPAWHSPMPGGTPVSELPATFEPNGFEYTGPALDSPELDAILIVAGLKCLRESNVEVRFSAYEKLGPFWFVGLNPGHALARAIKEVRR